VVTRKTTEIKKGANSKIMTRQKKSRIAVVHDWVITYAGAEIVLRNILNLLKKKDVYCLIRDTNNPVLNDDNIRNIRESYLQKIPGIKNYYKYFASFMPSAIESFDLKKYDLIVSSSWAFAHGIKKKSKFTKHLAYVHTPMRWAWDMEEDYLSHEHFVKFIQPLVQRQIRKLREWDQIAGQRPDKIIANSKFVQNRIKKYWGRDSKVIYPPVEVFKTGHFENHGSFVSICRLVPYKRVDLIVRAFNKLPDKKLMIVGSGPELPRLKRMANSNIKFIGRVTDNKKSDILQGSVGFVQASKEDFGISLVEAQACGIPVVAFGEGGAKETVLDAKISKNPTGVFFLKQSEDEIVEKILEFIKIEFNADDCIRNAEKFSAESFRDRMLEQINSLIS